MQSFLSHLSWRYGYLHPQALRGVRASHRSLYVVFGPLFLWILLARAGNTQQAPSSFLPPQASAKLSLDLAQTLTLNAEAERIPVIVQTNGRSLNVLLSSLQQQSYQRQNATHSTPERACLTLDPAGMYAASLSKEQLLALANCPSVTHVSADLPLHTCQDYATQTVGADIAWNSYGLTGAGVTVAVLDTGVYTHMDLGGNANRLVGWNDLVNGKKTPYDDNGHGTHVTGIVAGNGTESAQGSYSYRLMGMAPNVSIVGVKVLDKSGSGSVSTVIMGINWCIAHRNQYNIRVLNLSLGHPIAESFQTDPLCQACERAWKAGILVVCAAGNMGRSVPDDPTSAPAYGTILSPGNDPCVLTVGATNTRGTPTRADDVIASYSSRGPSVIDFVLKPDILAPGDHIGSLAAPNSSLYLAYPANQIASARSHGIGTAQYFRLSGTSMACPIVAGAAALLLQGDPFLTPDSVKARLMVSATKSLTKDPFSYGAGYLNIPAALACRINAPLGANSPLTARIKDGTIQIKPDSKSNNAIWGTNLIWGDNKTASRAIWGAFAWNGNGISTNCVWNGKPGTAGAASNAFLEAIMIYGDE